MTPYAGDEFSCGGITVEVLCEPINYESYNNINPTGIILKVNFPKQSVLFLGDFDAEAEKEYKEHFSVEKLRCDVVQMAHHGQDGVSRSFYELIKPKYCLYTAPDWLWENNSGASPQTRGKGDLAIMETRLWMAQMSVFRSFHMADGDWYFE